MTENVRETLCLAAKSGRVEEVSALLKDNFGLDVNWGDCKRWTALHHASEEGHAEVVKLLLAHPNINVNALDAFGESPFSYS